MQYINTLPGTRAALRSATGAVVFSDNFNRADGAIGNGWQVYGGAAAILSNRCDLGSSSGGPLIVHPSAAMLNGEVTATLNLGNGCSVGLVLRYASDSAFYLFDVQASGTIEFYRKAGDFVLLSSFSGPSRPANTDFAVRVVAADDTFSVSVNDVLLTTFTDSAYAASGTCGLRNGGGGNGNRLVDDFTVQSNA